MKVYLFVLISLAVSLNASAQMRKVVEGRGSAMIQISFSGETLREEALAVAVERAILSSISQCHSPIKRVSGWRLKTDVDTKHRPVYLALAQFVCL